MINKKISVILHANTDFEILINKMETLLQDVKIWKGKD